MANKAIIVWSKVGCSYCKDVKDYLQQQNLAYKEIDVTEHDEFRDILDVKYGVRHVPVVEIGDENNYQAITEVGLEFLKKALQEQKLITETV